MRVSKYLQRFRILKYCRYVRTKNVLTFCFTENLLLLSNEIESKDFPESKEESKKGQTIRSL